MDLLSYLDDKNVQYKRTASADQIYTHCFFCDEPESKKGRLYLNIEPGSEKYGLYFCHLCNSSGNLRGIVRHFGDDPDALVGKALTPAALGIFDAATTYFQERLLENKEPYEYLTHERGLERETIERFKFGWDDGGLLTHLVSLNFSIDDIRETGLVNHFGSDFLEDNITIPYLEYGRTVTIRGKKIGGKYLSLPGSTAHLFGVDLVRGEREVVLTAGEMDCIVLFQLGYAACGVPGENIWKEEWESHLEDAGRIYILFDNDNAGKAGAEKLAPKLGGRGRVASFPEGPDKIDVSSYVMEHGRIKDDFDMIFMRAKGGMLISPYEAYDRWLEVEGNPDLVGLRFNIEEIDRVMSHGLLPAQVATLVARSNTGKTIMTLNILYRMLMTQPDLQVLFISLEQTRNEWFERAHRIHNFYNPGSTVLDTVNFWKDNFYMVDKNRLTREELEVCIDQFAFDAGRYPDIVAVDYLGYYARGYKGDEYGRLSDAVMDLKAIAKDRRLVVFLPHQANRSGTFGQEFAMDQGHGSGVVEHTSDFMLALWAPDQMVGTEDREQKRQLHMKILKSRDGGVNTKALLQFAPLTLATVPRSDPLFIRAVRETQYLVAGDDWKTAVQRHLTGDESITLGDRQ